MDTTTPVKPVPSVPPQCECQNKIKKLLATLSIEVHIHTSRPKNMHKQIIPATCSCSHRSQFWCEPTNDQIIKWREDGVA